MTAGSCSRRGNCRADWKLGHFVCVLLRLRGKGRAVGWAGLRLCRCASYTGVSVVFGCVVQAQLVFTLGAAAAILPEAQSALWACLHATIQVCTFAWTLRYVMRVLPLRAPTP